jgi:hypothetical protein
MRRATLIALVGVIALAVLSWAVPVIGAAHFLSRLGGVDREQRRKMPVADVQSVPTPVRFREVRDRGLLVKAWLNSHGPYTFAVDTGAGTTVVAEAVVLEARLPVRTGRRTVLGGLSGSGAVTNREALITSLALGEPGNRLPAQSRAVIAPVLPRGIDGILDPTEAYAPLGYSIDLPGHEIQAFDPKVRALSVSQPPAGGSVVPWAREAGSRRPFVRLNDGRLALLDTGSGFGFAISEQGEKDTAKFGRGSRDLSGQTIQSRRVAPSVVGIGSLVLRGVPTDLLRGVEKGAPVILGRDALYPFRISFDPVRRLIEFAPVLENDR